MASRDLSCAVINITGALWPEVVKRRCSSKPEWPGIARHFFVRDSFSKTNAGSLSLLS